MERTRSQKRQSTFLTAKSKDRDQIFFKKFSLNQILEAAQPLCVGRTKIVCTIGPKCWDVETLCGMIDRGMTVARLNFSHGDHKMHGETVGRLREAFKLRKDKQCAIMLDTKGPEIRTGLLKDHKAITLKKGQDLEISTDYAFEGDATKITCSYKSLPKSVKEGSQILIADGSLVCKVKKILEDGVAVEVLNDATIGEKKNMNLPGVIVDLPTITEKDEDDLVNFGLKYGVDMVAASFIRKASDVEYIRDILGPRGAHIQIISKIENQEGLENYEEILEASDGIMVARGDLGMEIPVQKVFIAQKWMIRKANLAAKTVITATQMMESMIKNPRPTRAEVSDVANAVLDGTDCVMLSGETANGDYPLAAVEIMGDICAEAELCFDRYSNFETLKKLTKKETPEEAIASSAVQISQELGIKLIICLTETGKTARFLSKYRPEAHIIAISVDDHTVKGLCTSRGVQTLKVPSFIGTDSLVDHAIKAGKEHYSLQTGDSILVIHGTQEGNPEQSNLLKIVQI